MAVPRHAPDLLCAASGVNLIAHFPGMLGVSRCVYVPVCLRCLVLLCAPSCVRAHASLYAYVFGVFANSRAERVQSHDIHFPFFVQVSKFVCGGADLMLPGVKGMSHDNMLANSYVLHCQSCSMLCSNFMWTKEISQFFIS